MSEKYRVPTHDSECVFLMIFGFVIPTIKRSKREKTNGEANTEVLIDRSLFDSIMNYAIFAKLISSIGSSVSNRVLPFVTRSLRSRLG